MKKNFLKSICYLIILGFFITSFTGCSNDNDKVSKEKIESELKYLDTKLVALLNDVNGINLQNYVVKSEEIKEESQNSGSQSGSSNSSSENSSSNENKSSNNQEESSEKEENKNSNSQSSTTSNMKYSMEGNEILLQDRTPKWKNAKSEIEKLYNTWSTIVLDLYKVNINNQDILNFNSDLDNTTQAIKNEDKNKSLSYLAKLYSYLPKYLGSISNDMKKVNLYKTKSSILNAYAAVEQDDLVLVKKELLDAEQSFLPIINDINSNANNQSSINKTYILIKELQNSADNTDKDIFYIKYKNLIQEIENIK